MNISDKILAVSAELGPKKKELGELTAKLEDITKQVAETEDADQEELLLAESEEVGKQLDTLTGEVTALEKKLDGYRAIEKRSAAAARPAGESTGEPSGGPAFVKRQNMKHKPAQSIVRLGVVKALAHLRRMPDSAVAEELYGDDDHFKAVYQHVTKTAAPVATTTDTDYASALVQEEVRGLMEDIESMSVAAALSLWAQRSGGMLENFGGAASIRVPVLSPTGATPSEPAWVQEGGAIPVGSLQIGSKVISRYKLAEILVTTMELRERSLVDVEALFRRAIARAYSRVLDNSLLSAAAAVAGVRPAGLLNGLAGDNTGAGDANGGIDSVTADLQAMTAAIMANNESAVPVLLINSQTRMAMSFITSALGEYVFQSQLESGRVLNIPVVYSGNVKPADTAIMVDASSLAMALDVPEFDVSQVATVVMADADGTAPTMADDGAGAVGTAGQVPTGINVVQDGVTPVHAAGYTARSLWQTYSEGVRMIAPASWFMMRDGVVAQRTSITWV